MANICSFSGVVTLPKEQKEKFLSAFDWNNDSVRHIRRTNFDVSEIEEEENPENVIIRFYGDCAWSILCCWDKPDDEECISMVTLLKECRAEHMHGFSEEEGIGFYEFFRYQEGDEKLTIECFDFQKGPEKGFFARLFESSSLISRQTARIGANFGESV